MAEDVVDVKKEEIEQFDLMQFLAMIGAWFLHGQKLSFHELVEKQGKFGNFIDFDKHPEKFVTDNFVQNVRNFSETVCLDQFVNKIGHLFARHFIIDEWVVTRKHTVKEQTPHSGFKYLPVILFVAFTVCGKYFNTCTKTNRSKVICSNGVVWCREICIFSLLSFNHLRHPVTS